jgi:hypothetical protein
MYIPGNAKAHASWLPKLSGYAAGLFEALWCEWDILTDYCRLSKSERANNLLKVHDYNRECRQNLEHFLFMTSDSSTHKLRFIPFAHIIEAYRFDHVASAELESIFTASQDNKELFLKLLEQRRYWHKREEKDGECLLIALSTLYNKLSYRQINGLLDGTFFIKCDEETERPVVMVPPDSLIMQVPVDPSQVLGKRKSGDADAAKMCEFAHTLSDAEQADWVDKHEQAWREVTNMRRQRYLQIIAQLARL